jgi:hypothetical protein
VAEAGRPAAEAGGEEAEAGGEEAEASEEEMVGLAEGETVPVVDEGGNQLGLPHGEVRWGGVGVSRSGFTV